MNHHFKTFIACTVGLLMLASCSPFKPKQRVSAEKDLPSAYSLYTGEFHSDQKWWKEFQTVELDHLIEEALSGNFSLKETWARLKQANAAAIQAGADLSPDLTGKIGIIQARSKSGSRNSSRGIEDYSIGLVSSYELDLWGRIRSIQEAAILQATATRQDLYTASMTLSAEIAKRWIRIISQRQQIRLLQKQLETNRTFLSLIELRFINAMVSALDVYQQQQVLENVMAEIPLAEKQEKLFTHELAVLLGRLPMNPPAILQTELPVVAAVPKTGLPADLLANRPDIRAAGLRLQSSDWQVAAARANRLPSLSLTASATYGQGDLDVLFNNWLLSLAGNLTAPIIDGKRRATEVEKRLAVTDERLWAYRQTVLTAIKEVEDALVSESQQRIHIKALEQVQQTAQRGLDEAIERYRNGLSDYLPVLTQLTTLQRLERDLINKRRTVLIDRIDLHRALGGAWFSGLKPEGVSTDSSVKG